jgi:hypothetical protein
LSNVPFFHLLCSRLFFSFPCYCSPLLLPCFCSASSACPSEFLGKKRNAKAPTRRAHRCKDYKRVSRKEPKEKEEEGKRKAKLLVLKRLVGLSEPVMRTAVPSLFFLKGSFQCPEAPNWSVGVLPSCQCPSQMEPGPAYTCH